MQQFATEFLAVADALQLWARLRIRQDVQKSLDPEDIVQETCIRAYTNYSSFDPTRGSFRNWIFGIATHVLLKQLRALRRQGVIPESPRTERTPDVDLLLDSVSSVTSQIARREALAAVLAEAQQLEREERWLFVYRGLEGLEFAEIGERLGMHPEAARSRWRRVVERLRRRPGIERFLRSKP